jgi:hypothetical protein
MREFSAKKPKFSRLFTTIVLYFQLLIYVAKILRKEISTKVGNKREITGNYRELPRIIAPLKFFFNNINKLSILKFFRGFPLPDVLALTAGGLRPLIIF